MQRLILSTKLPTAPADWLEGALADADLKHLGGPAFMEHNDRLRAELAAYGEEFSDVQWLANQLAVLRGQEYHTTEARELWGAAKQANIARLEDLLGGAKSGNARSSNAKSSKA